MLAVAAALLVAACLPATAGAVERRAVIAFVPGATLTSLSDIGTGSVAMLGATQGRYRQMQAVLDLSQGARTSLPAYDPVEPPALGVLPDGVVAGWRAAVRRADAAPAPIVPGLFAGSIPGGAAWAGKATASRDTAIVAADRSGRVARIALVDDADDAGVAARRALRRHRLVVVLLPGERALRTFVEDRRSDTLVIAMAAPPMSLRTRLLPVAVYGLGDGRTLTSATTRTQGLVTGIDVAPTVLEWLGLPVPDHMTGQPMRLDGALDLHELTGLRSRLGVVTERRYPTLAVLAGTFALLLLAAAAVRRRAGARWAVRTGALAVLWLLPVLLAFAALRPSRTVEVCGVAFASLLLGALTDRLVRWPVAPAVPGLIGVAAYALDLAFGSPLIVTSLLGPNPLFGSRFYGIGNELESTLPVLLLCGLAAAMVGAGRGGRSRALALTFGVGGLLLGAVIGSGRLGADVGGVITVGAGTAMAVLLALPGGVTRRRAVVAVLVPVAALGALALLDLATGGDGHFTRSVLRAGDREALEDVVVRRYHLAYNNLVDGIMPLLVVLALGGIAWAVARRDRLLAGVPGADAWGAALAGSAAAGVVGALSNDSGPLLLVFATFAAAWVTGYLRAGARSDRRRDLV
ncbi:MAG TPA: hypothetical protein VFR97_11540 [Capillimicrobium sp.]|nr:hypothetical protein [Capillimicrobium sp.]